MLTYLSASKVFPVSTAVIDNGVLAIDDLGYIKGIYSPEEAATLNLPVTKHYEGYFVPGFINTHCHLELAHMKGQIPMHTGLFGFIGQVMKNRNANDAVIIAAMEQADQQMFDQGIVAVADIANQIISKAVKLKSKLRYHTFVEAMGFNPANAEYTVKTALETKEAFAPLDASVVPHAPYSVSDNLFAAISALSANSFNLLSIHNQETSAEDEFFRSKTGDFLNLYKMLGLDLEFYRPSGKSSLQTTLPKLPLTKTLLVHNTKTSREDVSYATAHHPELYWCLCPNANLYIEDTLPDVAMLEQEGLNITLGTDSLASNHQLSILKEMQTLQEEKSVSFETLLKWGTINGARFLGLDDTYGTFSIGKKPGVIFLEDIHNSIISDSTRIKRIF
jgi:cytosine/adenosine deaminase-related metal-dependent hydrolase